MQVIVMADDWVQRNLRWVTYASIIGGIMFWWFGPISVGWVLSLALGFATGALTVIAIIAPLALLTWPLHRGEFEATDGDEKG